jgi:hypothetical protein
MKMLRPVVLGLSLAIAAGALAAAQDTASMPQILQITREVIKPYKNGMAHDKTESAFQQAMTKAKFPAYYVGVDSLSGTERALFLTGYSSFAEWEKDNKLVDKNPALGAELEHASIADGELLSSVDSLVYTYSEELSYKAHSSLEHARYLEITVFHVRLGHGDDWRKLGKMVKDTHDKAGTNAHWAMYEAAYGADDGTYILLSADNSMADIDTGFADGKKFHDALGDEGMKKLDALYGATVESAHSELFSINPKQSYVPEEWIKADPDFWKPKAASTKPAATKKPTP